MKIEKTEVYGFKSALRGMRNAYNSWDKSDSTFVQQHHNPLIKWNDVLVYEMPQIGPNDMKLACKLIKAGPEHRKFLRQITIICDITIPRYIWQELDTYKVATVRNSCSTMHKLGHTNLDTQDFHFVPPPGEKDSKLHELYQDAVYVIMEYLNTAGYEYRNQRMLKENNSFELVRSMKSIIPEGFLQKATYTMNYETALNMFHQRKNHKLPEWNIKNEGSICSWIKSLPYMNIWTELK